MPLAHHTTATKSSTKKPNAPCLFVQRDQVQLLTQDSELREALRETLETFDVHRRVHDRRLKTNSLVPRCKDIHQVRVTRDDVVFMKYDDGARRLFLLKFRKMTVITHRPEKCSDYSRALTSFEQLPLELDDLDSYQAFCLQ